MAAPTPFQARDLHIPSTVPARGPGARPATERQRRSPDETVVSILTPRRASARSVRKATPLVYILAASHSGSTLTAQLLASHPEITTVGELKASARGNPADYLCSCGVALGRCPFWERLRENLADRGHDFALDQTGTDIRAAMTPYLRRLLRAHHRGRLLEALRDLALTASPAWGPFLRGVQERNAALVAAISDVTGKRIVVDSSKVGLRLKYLLRNPDLDVKVVRLIRDGRGVALTYADPATFADARDPRLRGGGTGVTTHVRLSLEKAAWEWRRNNEEAEAVLAGIDAGRAIEVRYEQICRQPGPTLRRLFAFLGVREVEINTRQERHVVGNGMRLDWKGDVSLDERWREVLTPDDLRVFDRVAGELNRRYGYV